MLSGSSRIASILCGSTVCTEFSKEKVIMAIPVPEFAAIASLLTTRQKINLGMPTSDDDRGSSLSHFQTFLEPGAEYVNSVEMHADGTIYVAYTPLKGPVWYDTFKANENDDFKNTPIRAGSTGPRPFVELKNANQYEANWLPPSQAYPPGRGPAPRWIMISPPPGIGPASWLNFLQSGLPDQVLRIIPGETPNLPSSCAYCFRDTWSPVNIGGPPEWPTNCATRCSL
jgi:hypothetical protein